MTATFQTGPDRASRRGAGVVLFRPPDERNFAELASWRNSRAGATYEIETGAIGGVGSPPSDSAVETDPDEEEKNPSFS